MTPSYLLDHLHEHSSSNISFRKNVIRPPFSRTDRYDNSFFPFCINNWNNSDSAIKSFALKGILYTQYVTVLELNFLPKLELAFLI